MNGREKAQKAQKKPEKKFFERNGFKPARAISRVKNGWKTLAFGF
jgi:hypothetical protein